MPLSSVGVEDESMDMIEPHLTSVVVAPRPTDTAEDGPIMSMVFVVAYPVEFLTQYSSLVYIL
jgi:hypothetical protein